MTSPAVSSMPARVAAWARTHHGQAAAGAGILGVGGFALYKRHAAAAAGDATAATDAGTIAGLSGNPDTTSADAGNAFQDQINSLANLIDQNLSNPKPPAPPAPPKPLDRIGPYIVGSSDTLAKIAKQIYGSDASWAVNRLKYANPLLKSFGANDPLGYYRGRSLHIWRAPDLSKKHK